MGHLRKITLTLFLVFLLSLTTAATEKITPITVKTIANTNVEINVLNPQTFDVLETFKQNSGATGEFTVTSKSTQPTIYLIVKVKKENMILFSERFNNYKTGEQIKIYLPKILEETGKDSTPENSTNQTAENNTAQNNTTVAASTAPAQQEQVTQEPVIPQAPLTGQAVSETESVKTNWIYYIIAIVVIMIAIAMFMMRKKLFKEKLPGPTKTKSTPEYESSINKELAQAERKLAEAQTEIQRIKNRDKILIAEKKLEEDRVRLEKLKSGYDPDRETGSRFKRRF
jgi:hypothetical protein